VGRASGKKAEQTSYVLCHHPKFFDWRLRKAKAHPAKILPDELFVQAYKHLNQIIQLG
jgi:mRNA interferase MazF